MTLSREWRLVRRPQGWPVPDDVALVEREVTDPGENQILVRNLFLSVDPYMRGRMNATSSSSYAVPYALGKAMLGTAVGRVEKSRSAAVPEGALVRTMRGWREWALCRADEAEIVDGDAAPPQAYLGILGSPGHTAWVGVFDIGEVRPSETMFVSAASGAVGSIAGQLAKTVGCRVVGSAGSAEKVRYLREQLRFDAAFNYNDSDVTPLLEAAAPEGVDVYFDNVGGDHLRAALERMNTWGRIVVCGMISSYNERQPGPDNLFCIVAKRLRMTGFLVADHNDRRPLFERHVGGLLREGRISYEETIREGIESAFDALIDVLAGGRHMGKMLIRL